MAKFFKVLQWLLAIAILLFMLGSFFGILLLTWWYSNPSRVVYAAQPVVNPTPSITQERTSTRTPFQPLPTATITPTAVWTDTPTATQTPTITLTPEPTYTVEVPPTEEILATEGNTNETFPAEASVAVTGYGQSYSLDCEARSAVDLAGYFGISIGEYDFVDALPRSDDPDEGFVGDFWGYLGNLPPDSYGVHAGPVAAVLRAYGLNAWDQHGMSWESLQMEIASGRPAMAWVTGNTTYGYAVSYTASSNGHTTNVARYEHTVLVIGYDPAYVTILDPEGGIIYQRTIGQFLSSWGVLGNMAIVVVP